jgi:hypothetical protein
MPTFVSPPPSRATFDETDSDGKPVRANRAWTGFIDSIFAVCFAQSQSGTTAQRPTVGLYVGRRYFDTTEGIPIFYNGTAWIDAAGNSV